MLRPGFRFWLVLLLLALGAGLALLDPHDASVPNLIPKDQAGEPDYYLKNARLTRFDADGQPHQRVDTPRLVHTPLDDVTRLETPDIALIDDSGRNWLASAEQGVLGPDGNPLTLTGNAHLEAPAERWRLDTETLHYDNTDGHAWSETRAVLRQPPQEMVGDRFDAWIHDNRARLTDNVTGYHPPKPQEESAQ
ncbi:LPS export ABC transporter periplasmic protein LptC [Halomonas sp. V046]|uniref:LPS export ABC transporter periplasmic protein LptC n=1 Tax=Halomonas sp. V046 TaxID=3459611 RepID=UPI004044AE63